MPAISTLITPFEKGAISYLNNLLAKESDNQLIVFMLDDVEDQAEFIEGWYKAKKKIKLRQA